MTGPIEPLNHFVQACLQTNLTVTDMNYRNLVYEQKSGKKQLWIVDGFGDHRMFSLRGVSRHYNHRKLIECFEKVSRQTGMVFETRTNQFSLGAT